MAAEKLAHRIVVLSAAALAGAILVNAFDPKPAAAQTGGLGESAKELIGSWEFSTADRERTCTVTFKADRAANGYRVEFEPKCVEVVPFVKDVVSWKFPDNDLLRLLDATGKSLIEFSEVESGIYEAPVVGYGVLFLQNADAAGPPPPPPDQFVGDWSIMRGGKALCAVSLTVNAAEAGFALTVKPGCDAAIVRLGFANWRIDRDELMLHPARGNPWRFEEAENKTWTRVPAAPNPYTLVRQ